MITAIAVSPEHTFITNAWWLAVGALRLFLGAVFLVSGTGKIWDLKGTRQALSDFGVKDSWTERGSIALPAVELLVGFGLLFDLSRQPSAMLAAVLSLSFSLAIANLLRQGRTPPCHCFGAIQSAPVGPATLARAVLLCAFSAMLLFASGPNFTPDLKSHIQVAGGALLIASFASNIVFWKQLHKKTSFNKRLLPGQRLPALKLFGDHWLSDKLSTEKKNVILLTSATCGACKSVTANLQQWRTTFADELNILELRSVVEEPEQELGTVFIPLTELSKLSLGTPGALLVDEKGTIISPPVLGREEIEALLKVATGQTPSSRPTVTFHIS